MTAICDRCDARSDGTAAAIPEGWVQETSALTGATFLLCGTCSAGKPQRSQPTGDRAADQLRLYIERIERIEEEERGIKEDKKDVYLEAKATGYDVKVMREIVKLRRMPGHALQEFSAVLETYKCALGME